MSLLEKGCTALVTGVTNPLGRATALALTRRGVRVLMVAREWEAGFRVRDEARNLADENNSPELFFAEFSLLPDSRALAARIRERTEALDAIFHFSGLRPAFDEPPTTEEPQPSFVYNVLSPFVLTNELKDLLSVNAGRVVSDVSAAWAFGRLDWRPQPPAEESPESELEESEGEQKSLNEDEFEQEDEEDYAFRSGDPEGAWADAQAARLLWTFALASRWQSEGMGARALRPGWLDLDVPAPLVPHERFGVNLLSIFAPSLEKLAVRALRLATDVSLGPDRVWWPSDHSHRLSHLEDPFLQQTLWDRLESWSTPFV